MVLKQRLEQKQVQRLILAPALQQAIKLLPLTNLELIEIIDEELSQNPMLEVEEETVEKTEEEEQRKEEEINTKNDETGNSDIKESVNSREKEDQEFEAYFQEYFDNEFSSFSSEKKESYQLENFVAKGTSLWDHLNWQANLEFFDEKDKETAKYIIGNINEEGYLMVSIEEIADVMRVSVERINRILDKIKRFDPLGVGSLTLRECLLTQIDYFGIKNKVIRNIVNNHLHLLENSNYTQLTRILGISVSELKSCVEIIKKLNPTPGRKYNEEKTFYVVPDIIVKKEDDEWKITLNDEGLPHLKINGYYKKLLNKASKENSEACRFLKDKMKKAFWFLHSLDQRNRTIYKVAKYVVDKQKDFIEKGIEYIKPLTLIELAQEIGVHESTVGRVVTNKFMITPRGIFPLKYFFHKSLSCNYGEEVSSLIVKEKIKKLIENEDKKNPLSDVEIKDILAKLNFKIARRTVAKYRKQMNIPPSHIRKRKYLMEES